MIAVAATGYDVVDIAYCKEHGIAVANIRNYAVHTVPEHAFALILALRRNLLAYRQDVDNGVWNKSDQFCFFTHAIGDLHGATLGIIGEGAIGQGRRRSGAAFGMRVLFADHPPPKMEGVTFTPHEAGAGRIRCDLVALPVDARDAQPDQHRCVPQDEAQRASHQYRAWRVGR